MTTELTNETIEALRGAGWSEDHRCDLEGDGAPSLPLLEARHDAWRPFLRRFGGLVIENRYGRAIDLARFLRPGEHDRGLDHFPPPSQIAGLDLVPFGRYGEGIVLGMAPDGRVFGRTPGLDFLRRTNPIDEPLAFVGRDPVDALNRLVLDKVRRERGRAPEEERYRSGYLPHVSETLWSAGFTFDWTVPSLRPSQAALLRRLGVDHKEHEWFEWMGTLAGVAVEGLRGVPDFDFRLDVLDDTTIEQLSGIADAHPEPLVPIGRARHGRWTLVMDSRNRVLASDGRRLWYVGETPMEAINRLAMDGPFVRESDSPPVPFALRPRWEESCPTPIAIATRPVLDEADWHPDRQWCVEAIAPLVEEAGFAAPERWRVFVASFGGLHLRSPSAQARDLCLRVQHRLAEAKDLSDDCREAPGGGWAPIGWTENDTALLVMGDDGSVLVLRRGRTAAVAGRDGVDALNRLLAPAAGGALRDPRRSDPSDLVGGP